jgi:predicted nucleic acid-binding protein
MKPWLCRYASHTKRWICLSASGHQYYFSGITLAEIEYGIARLAFGHKRDTLVIRFKQFVSQGFGGRLLAFDDQSAQYFSHVMSLREQQGRPMSFPDGQIAAIALQHRLPLARRNLNDFEGVGLLVVNPFDVQAL